MLGADGLNLALMIADSGIIDAAVNDLMGRSQVMMMAEHRGSEPRCVSTCLNGAAKCVIVSLR